MIIKSKNIRTGGTKTVVSYVHKIGENEEVEFIDGSPSAFEEVDVMAKLNGHKCAAIHLTISPNKELGPAGLQLVIDEIYDEMGVDEDAPFVLMRHSKMRNDGKTDASHYHLILPAADSSGKVYDRWKSKMRDEAVSRICELRLGHDIVPGAHNGFVSEHLRKNGRDALAEEFERALNGDPSPRVSDYSESMNHLINRIGEGGLKKMILSFASDMKGKPAAEIASALHGFEMQFPDVKFEAGTRGKNSRIVALLGDKFFVGLRTQLDINKDKISEILKLKGKYRDGGYRQNDRGDSDQSSSDRGESGRHRELTLRRRSGEGAISTRSNAGGAARGTDAPEARRDRDSRHATDDHEGARGRKVGAGRASVPRLKVSERAMGRLAARRVRLRIPRDTQPTVRVSGVDLRTGNKFAARAKIREMRAEFVMQGPRPVIRPVDKMHGDRAAAALKARRPHLGGRGKIRVSYCDRILGDRAAGRLSELRREHKAFMSTPLDLSTPSGANQILDIDDPMLMAKLSDQMKASMRSW
jgi:hypothetical protein